MIHCGNFTNDSANEWIEFHTKASADPSFVWNAHHVHEKLEPDEMYVFGDPKPIYSTYSVDEIRSFGVIGVWKVRK